LSETVYSRATSRYRGTFVDRVPADAAARWLEDPEALCAGADPWPAGRPARTATADSAIGPVFVKHERGARRRLCWRIAWPPCARISSSRRAFEIGLRLEQEGVDAARPLAVIDGRDESFSMQEHVDARDLRHWLLDGLAGCHDDDDERGALKSAVWTALAGTIASLHRSGTRQRDLKAPNILVARQPDGAPRPTLVDLEGMGELRGGRGRRLRARARDLGRLLVSLREDAIRAAGVDDADWRKLVERYLEASRDETIGTDATWWIDRTLRWAIAKERRNRRRGRPIQ